MGNVHHVLAQADLNTRQWPYIDRLIMEDCETIHVHINNLRLEFHREQFLALCDLFRTAADNLRTIMDEEHG